MYFVFAFVESTSWNRDKRGRRSVGRSGSGFKLSCVPLGHFFLYFPILYRCVRLDSARLGSRNLETTLEASFFVVVVSVDKEKTTSPILVASCNT